MTMDQQVPRGPLGDLSAPDIDDGTLALRQTPGPGVVEGAGPRRRAAMCWGSPDFNGALSLDEDAFIAGYEAEKAPFRKLDQTTRDNLLRFVRALCADGRITNVHMVAYILATTLHECRSAANKWVTTWSPVSETRSATPGAYFKPVTARDFSGWPIGATGASLPAALDAKGVSKLGKHKPATLGDGELGKYFDPKSLLQRAYYGRGYVQITHLDNYRAMDEALGLAGTLIANPELALDHDIAMKITVYGMVNGSFRGSFKHVPGKGYIGGHKLADYGADYKKARAIINSPTDQAETIAGYARIFERLVQDSRLA